MRHNLPVAEPHIGSVSSLYEDLAAQLDSLLAGETDVVANLANAAAVIYHGLPNLNWAGFYITRGRTLVLGPFQGKPACVRIELGKGVCGTRRLGPGGGRARVSRTHRMRCGLGIRTGCAADPKRPRHRRAGPGQSGPSALRYG
jgi:hypothetical protein